MSAPARPRARRRRAPLFEPGLIPFPGGLLDWRDPRHYDHHGAQPCALCSRPTPLRSHHGEPVHKVCAEDWITTHPTESRQGRFASDTQPKSGQGDAHA